MPCIMSVQADTHLVHVRDDAIEQLAPLRLVLVQALQRRARRADDVGVHEDAEDEAEDGEDGLGGRLGVLAGIDGKGRLHCPGEGQHIVEEVRVVRLVHARGPVGAAEPLTLGDVPVDTGEDVPDPGEEDEGVDEAEHGRGEKHGHLLGVHVAHEAHEAEDLDELEPEEEAIHVRVAGVEGGGHGGDQVDDEPAAGVAPDNGAGIGLHGPVVLGVGREAVEHHVEEKYGVDERVGDHLPEAKLRAECGLEGHAVGGPDDEGEDHQVPVCV